MELRGDSLRTDEVGQQPSANATPAAESVNLTQTRASSKSHADEAPAVLVVSLTETVTGGRVR